MKRDARTSAEKARQWARAAAAQLARDPRVHLVYLFGSAADESVKEVRDVDLAIRTVPPLDFEERLRLRADLVESIGGDFDLVSLDEASVVLAREIADRGMCLFSCSSEDEVDFVTRARSRFWDFKPYLDEQWRLAAERQENRRRGSEA